MIQNRKSPMPRLLVMMVAALACVVAGLALTLAGSRHALGTALVVIGACAELGIGIWIKRGGGYRS